MEIYKNNLAGRTIRFLTVLMVRLFPKSILKVISRTFFKKINYPLFRYFYYFLSSRIFEREYLHFLKANDLFLAVRKKNEWANFILESSVDEYETNVAEHYLSTLSKFGYADYNNSQVYLNDKLKKITQGSEEIFYLYGPNSPKLKIYECFM